MNMTRFAIVLILAAVCSVAMGQNPPSAVESAMVKAVDAQTPAAIAMLEKLVNINSGTMNLAGVVAVKDVVAPQIEALGFKVKSPQTIKNKRMRFSVQLPRHFQSTSFQSE